MPIKQKKIKKVEIIKRKTLHITFKDESQIDIKCGSKKLVKEFKDKIEKDGLVNFPH